MRSAHVSLFQRVLTNTLSILVNKCVTLVVMGDDLVITGHAVLTPLLQALSMLAGDLVTMSRAADHAGPSPYPNHWRVQANTYILRERGHFWHSRPAWVMVLASIADLTIVTGLVLVGLLLKHRYRWLSSEVYS